MLNNSKNPCKLVKIDLKEIPFMKDSYGRERGVEPDFDLEKPVKTFTPNYIRGIFLNCFILESRILLSTDCKITLFDHDLKQLSEVIQKAIHKDVWAMWCCQAVTSIPNNNRYIFSCDMHKVRKFYNFLS